jgi:hypothetical protein
MWKKDICRMIKPIRRGGEFAGRYLVHRMQAAAPGFFRTAHKSAGLAAPALFGASGRKIFQFILPRT